MPLQQALTGEVFASIREHAEHRLIYEAAGQSVFAIEAETNVQAPVETLVRGMEKAWSRMQRLASYPG